MLIDKLYIGDYMCIIILSLRQNNMDKWDYDETQFAKKSKKFNKKVQNVPIQELGFKPRVAPDIIDPRNMKRIRRTKKYVWFYCQKKVGA